jgi:hypothetical protein
MLRDEILEQVRNCVCVDRENTYGSPENNFSLIGALWDNYLFAKDMAHIRKGDHGHRRITGEDVAVMMTLLKVARIATGEVKADNYIDLAGYAVCAGELATIDIPESEEETEYEADTPEKYNELNGIKED